MVYYANHNDIIVTVVIKLCTVQYCYCIVVASFMVTILTVKLFWLALEFNIAHAMYIDSKGMQSDPKNNLV